MQTLRPIYGTYFHRQQNLWVRNSSYELTLI